MLCLCPCGYCGGLHVSRLINVGADMRRQCFSVNSATASCVGVHVFVRVSNGEKKCCVVTRGEF